MQRRSPLVAMGLAVTMLATAASVLQASPGAAAAPQAAGCTLWSERPEWVNATILGRGSWYNCPSGTSVTVVLTADHGGLGRSHSDPALAVNYTVPFLAWGVGVTPGTDLYAINPTYTDPKRAQTTYADAPIRNGDVANLALDLLELPAVPGSEHDATQDLVTLTAQPVSATG